MSSDITSIMGPSLVFRCDATKERGIGHVMRCLALAETAAARGVSVGFVCREDTARIAPALSHSGFPIMTASADGRDEIAALLAGSGRMGSVVIDGYDFGEEIEQVCRPLARSVLVFDDLADRRRDCGILLNASPGFSPKSYMPHVSAETRLLLGPAYALVHPSILAKRTSSLARRADRPPVSRVLIAFGGTDPANATSLALEAVSSLAGLAIDVALGSSAPYLDEVRARAGQQGARVYVDADMSSLIEEADLAIGAGGSTTWERCLLGLPSLIVTIADNQTSIARAAAQAGAAVNLGDHGQVEAGLLRDHLVRLIADTGRRAEMACCAAGLIDGAGAARVLAEILA